MTFANKDQAEYWAGRAQSWMSLEDQHERVIGEAGRLAMERLDPRPGQVLVDLGCGTGKTTVELARRVSPGGSVVGVDIAEAMFELARQHAGEAGVDNVEFVHADVQSSDLGEGRFDGAYSRFGVMFFADAQAAFTNLRRSLKAGATLSFACWQPVFSNDWMLVPTLAAVEVLGVLPEIPAPDAPGPFSLSDPERVRAVLGGAGFRDVDVTAHDDLLRTPEKGIADLADSSLRVGAVQRMLEGADPETVERVRNAIDQALRARLKDGDVALSRAVLLVRATA